MEKIIIEQLLGNPDYFTKVWPFLNDETFKNSPEVGYPIVYGLIKKHYDKYNSVPTLPALKVGLDAQSISQTVYDFAFDAISEIEIGHEEDPTWLLDKTEEFVRNNAIFNATSKVLEIQENARKDPAKRDKKLPDVGIIPELLRDAISISFDTNVGHDWDDDLEERWKSYQTRAHKIPFNHKDLDEATNGGVENGTLNIILAPVGTGKSMGLIALSAKYLQQGLNVLYVSLEMSELSVATRLDAALLGFDMDDLNTGAIPFQNFKSRRNALVSKHKLGKFKVRQYATGTASANTVRALINELKLKNGFIPDVIMIDYLGICASFRIRTFTENSYTLVKAVAEEFRGLAIETGTALWTGAQTTRTAWGSGDIGMEDTAESAGLPATADLMIGVIETEQLAQEGKQIMKQLKNRYADKNKRLRIPISVNKQRQTWEEVDGDSNKVLNEHGFNSLGATDQTKSNVSKKDLDALAANAKF